MQCLILAGGLGTRMRPLTHTLPKILLPVKGRPFVFHQIELLLSHGVDKIVYSIGFHGNQVRDALGDGNRWGVRIEYVDEGPELRGTGGAVRLAYDSGVLDDVFCLLYGDSYLPIDYEAPWRFFQQRSEPALMTVFRNHGRFDQSNARLTHGKVFYDKKAAASGDRSFDCIDYGFSILRRSAVQRLPQAKNDLADLFHELSVERQLAGFEVSERFYEVGSPQGLKELEEYLGERSTSKPGS